MKGFLIFIALLGLIMSGTMWFTRTWLPNYHLKKLNEAAKKYMEDKQRPATKISQIMPYVDIPNLGGWIEQIKKPYHGEWIIDPDDEEHPVKIYHWLYFTCPNCGNEIPVESPIRPIEITCDECGRKYGIESDDELHKKKGKESVVEGDE